MTWIIIILIVAFVIGPIMYLVPTPKDKRLTALRLAARQAGLVVKLATLPKLDPKASERVTAGGKTLDPTVSCTSYELPLSDTMSNFGEIQLLRIPPMPTVQVNEVLPGWSLGGQDAEAGWSTYLASHGALAVLQQALLELPEDSLGLMLNDRFVACYWRERAQAEDQSVEQIRRSLDLLATDLVTRFR